MVRRVSRPQPTTLFAFGEGKGERTFLIAIRGLYADGRHPVVSVQIDNGNGGSARDVVETAIGRSEGVDFDRKVVLFDADSDGAEGASRRARQSDFRVVSFSPCLEAAVLRLLGDPIRADRCRSLKSRLRRRHGIELERVAPSILAERIGKVGFESLRATCAPLNLLVSQFEE